MREVVGKEKLEVPAGKPHGSTAPHDSDGEILGNRQVRGRHDRHIVNIPFPEDSASASA